MMIIWIERSALGERRLGAINHDRSAIRRTGIDGPVSPVYFGWTMSRPALRP
jgi:hypothetical protein